MSRAPIRRTSSLSNFTFAAFALLALTLLFAGSANAQPDTFGNGNGQDGAAAYGTAGTYSPNALAPIPGALSAGNNTVTLGTVRPGVGAGAVGFATNRLVMIYQSNGVGSAPTSGSQTAVSLSSSSAGHWELARVQSVAGSVLTLTSSLTYSYAAGTAQAVAVPEWSALTVSVTGVNLTAQAWNGTTGGVIAFLVSGTTNFSATGSTVSANTAGFRGGISYNENSGGITTCPTTDMNSPTVNGTYAMKGEGFYPAGYRDTTPANAATQQGRGNYLNAGGGGNCFNAGGGGGGNGGQGGLGGNTLVGHADGNRVGGGLGGAALTYNPYSQAPFGGGGGAGERNDANNTSGGAGGGFVLFRGNTLTGSGNFRANGAAGNNGNASLFYDGAGGGGAGGVILMRFTAGATCTGVSANGGAGGNNSSALGRDWTGGGGGAGGKTYVQGSTITCPQTTTGGAAGTNGGNAYGATAGGVGATTANATAFNTPATAPTIAITAPAAASYTNDTTPAVTGTSTANANITVYFDGVYSGTTTASGAGDWSYSPIALLGEGARTVTAYAEVAGVVTPASNAFTIDATNPVVAITGPAAGAIGTTTPAIAFTVTETNPSASSECRVQPSATWLTCTSTWSPTLAEGSNTVEIRHTDLAGNVSTVVTRTYVVDTTGPLLTVTTPAAASTTGPSGTYVFSATDDNGPVTYTCALDGGSAASCVSGDAYSALSDGSHTVVITASDAFGNSTGVTRTWNVDATPPVTTILTNPPAVTNSTTGDFTFSANETSTFECSIDGSSFSTCTSPSTYPGLAAGDHTFAVRATDASGNVESPAQSYDWSIDTTAPDAPAITVPASDLVTTQATQPISGTAEPFSTVEVYDDATLIGTATADGSGDWSLATDPTFTEGEHPITATATDEAGNTSDASNIRLITIDTTNPSVSITDPANDALLAVNTPDITFSATDTNLASVECSVDGVTFDTCASVWTTPTLSDGPYTITVRATDGAGNTAQDSINIIVDTTAPDAPVIDSPAADETTSDVRPPIGGTAEADAEITIYDGATQIGTATANGSGDWTFTPTADLDEGDHAFHVTATDAAGNVSDDSNIRTITIDTTAPDDPTITTPPSDLVTSDSTPSLAGEAEADSTVKIYEDATEIGSVQADGSGNWEWTVSPALDDGPHVFHVTATDSAGNTSNESNVRTITVDTTAPDAPVISTPATDLVTSETTQAIAGTAEAGSTVTVSDQNGVIGTAVADINGDWSLAPDPTFAEGQHTITATATDAVGNESDASDSVSITIDTTAPDAPEIDTPTDGDLTNDNTPAISGTAEPGASVKVFDGATQLCTATADINGDWSCVSSTLADGSHTLTATATDPSGNESDASEAVDIEVDATAPAKPVVAAPANGSTTADDTPAISGTAEEDADVEIFVDGNSIGHVTADGDGDWSITSAHLTDGVHVITAQATDEAGNTGLVSDSVSFTVDTTPPGGSVAQQPGTGTAPGTNPTFFIVPSEGNSTITCSLDGAAGAACGSPFTPAQKLAPGTHTLTVTFTDPSGNSHQESITFVVAGDAAASDATGCFAKGITIHNMKIVGSKLQIQGFARLSYVGKTVSIKYKPTKNKVVAKAIVQPDGSFTAITKAPKKSIRLSNDTRYSATVGSESTIWVKYSRRVGSAEASYSDGKLFVKGFLTKPLIKKAPAVISARTGCDGPWKNVASAKVSSGGQFNIAIPYTPSTGVVFVRVAANVAKGANSTKALKTYSYVIPVVVK